MHRILIIDDDPRHRELYEQTLAQAEFDTISAASADAARSLLDPQPELIVSDVSMPGTDGISFLKELREQGNDVPFLLVTAYPDVRAAVTALKLGAVDYLEKPVDLNELTTAVSDALHLPPAELDTEIPAAALEGIIAENRDFIAILEDCYRVAPTDATVLITGESGTGKEVVAQFTHANSKRSAQRFVAVNCAAIPQNLLASELFGHEKGAFTGADSPRAGRFREADGGTLFLDEIGDMPLDLQASLLRVIETGIINPLGSDREVKVDVRLVAATNRDLPTAVAAQDFREDLYYRLNVITFELPPLRQRRDDILPLARHFLRRGGESKRLSPAAARLMQNYHWPGNVRELANAAERARILSSTEVILPEHLPPAIRQADGQPQANTDAPVQTMEELERTAIQNALAETDGNRTKAAELLGISRRALLYKLKRYRLTEK